MQEWCTIESDPGVFTELISNIGVKSVEVEEIYDLNDDHLIQQLQPIYGLIFLFRWTSKGEKRECLKVYDSDLFFANQVIQNACATQAIISILLNNSDIDVGLELQNYKDFAINLDPQTRGLCLGNIEVIRQAHNSFARPEPFVYSGQKKAKEGDDVFHFVSYIPFKGRVYELDGMQAGPILLGEISEGVDWLMIAREAIMKRVSIYQEKEIAFSLLSVGKQKKIIIEEQLNIAVAKSIGLYERAIELGAPLDENHQQNLANLKAQLQSDIIKSNESDINTVWSSLKDLDGIIQESKALLEQQNHKYQQYKLENSRRRHNYIPMILEVLKMAARKGQLDELIENARNKQKQQMRNQGNKQQQQK